MPISSAAVRIAANVGARARSSSPTSENAIPITSEYGIGRRSVYRPTSGCSTDAVNCCVSVIRPTCAKLSANAAFSIG
jgi:hypothetical protein